MEAFSADWLALREPADARARSSAVVEAVLRGSGFSRDHPQESRLKPLPQKKVVPQDKVVPQEKVLSQGPMHIIDLGAGTGANLRYLAPRLGGKQDWLLVDSNSGLLDVARERLIKWATRLDARVETNAGRISIVADSFSAVIRTQTLDIARNLAALALPHGCLVTASALLDLVSQSWLVALADACRESAASVLFALTYDGRMTLAPPEPDDELVRTLFNRHQHNDKGFGPALGPDAAEAVQAAFAGRGYALHAEASDWRLGRDESSLQAALLDGWRIAATEIEPDLRSRLERWSARHRRRIATRESTLIVGHSDLGGVPYS